jgi:hypothetical protein
LPARTRSSTSSCLDFIIIEFKILILFGIEHSNSNRASMYTSAFFGGWDALPTMATRLVLEESFRSLTCEEYCDNTGLTL